MRLSGAVVVPIMLLLSGCSGDSGDLTLEPTDVGPSVDPGPSTVSPAPDEFVPKFHYHDYWAGRDKVTLFRGTVPIGRDRLQETAITSEGVRIGVTEFDTKLDGENVNLADSSDVVFQGTDRIEVSFRWSDTNSIPGLKFSFKPANTPMYTLLGPVQSGKTYTITLQPRWADMPHQLSLSRWKFMIEAYNPVFEGYPVKAHRAEGSVDIEMTIFNGGERYIDPPHPYFFSSGPVRYAGEINRTFTQCVFANNTRVADVQLLPNPVALQCGSGIDGFAVDQPHIIPWETTKVHVDLWYNYTGMAAAAATKLGLKFHASDSTKYHYPRPFESGPGYARYLLQASEAMTDSPYATKSDWRFGIYPILNDQRDYGGEFSGNLHLLVRAVKEGDTSERGMGN